MSVYSIASVFASAVAGFDRYKALINCEESPCPQDCASDPARTEVYAPLLILPLTVLPLLLWTTTLTMPCFITYSSR